MCDFSDVLGNYGFRAYPLSSNVSLVSTPLQKEDMANRAPKRIEFFSSWNKVSHMSFNFSKAPSNHLARAKNTCLPVCVIKGPNSSGVDNRKMWSLSSNVIIFFNNKYFLLNEKVIRDSFLRQLLGFKPLFELKKLYSYRRFGPLYSLSPFSR